MKLLERYSTFFVVLLFIIGATVYKEYLQAKRSQNTVHMSKTIGRYEHPFNSSIKGQKELRVDENVLELFKRLSYELEAGARVNAISEASYMSHLQPVTAISSNHLIELMARIDVMEKFLPQNIKIIVYDLGLKRHEVEELRNIPNVAYRVFDFSVFPTYVLNLHNYSWKPLIIQRILSEFGGVLWMDSSVVFQDSYDKIVQYMIEKNSSFLYYFKRAGHTILSGTDPRMLEFLPMKGTSEMTKYMPQAGAILIYNTRLVRDNIMRWVLACSLIEDCIAPSGPAHHCNNFPPDKFGGCHLYDQSLFAITVSNAYDSHEEKYTLSEEMSGFAYPWRVRSKERQYIVKQRVCNSIHRLGSNSHPNKVNYMETTMLCLTRGSVCEQKIKLHLAFVVKIIGTASGLSLLVLWSRLIAYGLVFVNAIIVLSFDVFSLWSITLGTDFTNSE